MNKNYMQISSRDSRYFELSDGTSFIPVGINISFPRFIKTEAELLEYYREYIGNFAANGGNYVRVWLGSPFFELEPEKEGLFSQTALNRIFALVKIGEESGVRLKFTLEHFRFVSKAFQNEMFQGAASFLKAAYHKDNGGSVIDMKSYFTTEAGHKIFRHKLKLLSENFKNNPTVAVWELWNEINAVITDDMTDWQQWTKQMLAEAHELFPNQLCVQSLGSFDSLDHYNMYNWLCNLPGNDFNQIHRYVDPGAKLDVCRGPMDVLASDAVAALHELNPDRPAILAESGAVEWCHCLPSHLYRGDVNGTLLHDALFAPFFSGSAGCGQHWHWEFYIHKHNLWWHFQRFSNAVAKIDPAAENYQPYKRDSQRLRFYGLKGETHSLLWVRDKFNTWQAELDQKQTPEVLKEISIDTDTITTHTVSRAEYYLPWEDKRGKLEIVEGKITLPDFKRSIVLKLLR